ncbi:MAG: DUF2269 family protein [Myxococcota bacterium]
MLYAALKTAHVLAVTLFFGAGLASVLLKLHADRSGDPRAIAFAHRAVVLADWVFTIPSGILLPLTGYWMVAIAGYDWRSGWVGWGLVLYVVAGVSWLPAWGLQFRMRDAAERAARTGEPLPAEYHRWTRIWALLGIPAFVAAVGAVWVMVAKGLAVG